MATKKKQNLESYFNYFKKCATHYQKKLNLNDIDIYFELDHLAGFYALTIYDDEDFNANRVVKITVDENWLSSDDVDIFKINSTALHEIIEVQLLNLRSYALNKTVLIPDFIIDQEIHRIIRTYEKFGADDIKMDK